MMTFIITPQGNLINLYDGTRPTLSSAHIIWKNNVGTTIDETYANSGQASYIFKILTNAILSGNPDMSTDFSNLSLPSGVLAWVSVAPTTFANGLMPSLAVVGSGFSLYGVSGIVLQNGSTNYFFYGPIQGGLIVYDDHNLAIYVATVSLGTGTWNVLFSLNGYADIGTYSATGLSIIVT